MMVDVYQRYGAKVPSEYATHPSSIATIEADDQIVTASGLLHDLLAARQPGVYLGNGILTGQSPIPTETSQQPSQPKQ
jgi:hypothetical protein